ncbi:MAG: SIMPL domain-containing protein, partial [Bdellovibrionia bacterium]
SVLRGYSVRHAVKITVRKLADLGGVVDLMGEAGINQLSLIRFSHNNKRDFEMKALAMAMEDSRGKAEVIARATGRALARATRAEYHTSETPEAVVRGEALREASDATEFIPGEIVIRASVSVTYEF